MANSRRVYNTCMCWSHDHGRLGGWRVETGNVSKDHPESKHEDAEGHYGASVITGILTKLYSNLRRRSEQLVLHE